MPRLFETDRNDIDPVGFEAFWKEYPNHKAKKDALKAWRSIRPTADTQLLILEALSWQKLQRSWLKDHGEFVPYAATWLRGERWTDQPISVPRPTKTRVHSKVFELCGHAGINMHATIEWFSQVEYYEDAKTQCIRLVVPGELERGWIVKHYMRQLDLAVKKDGWTGLIVMGV